MLDIFFTNKFKKDYKKCKKQGRNLKALSEVISKLRAGVLLDKKYHDHGLSGNYSGSRECHIEPDFLLIYRIDNNKLTLTAVRLGSHSELFS